MRFHLYLQKHGHKLCLTVSSLPSLYNSLKDWALQANCQRLCLGSTANQLYDLVNSLSLSFLFYNIATHRVVEKITWHDVYKSLCPIADIQVFNKCFGCHHFLCTSWQLLETWGPLLICLYNSRSQHIQYIVHLLIFTFVDHREHG